MSPFRRSIPSPSLKKPETSGKSQERRNRKKEMKKKDCSICCLYIVCIIIIMHFLCVSIPKYFWNGINMMVLYRNKGIKNLKTKSPTPLSICNGFLKFFSLKYRVWWTGFFPMFELDFSACKIKVCNFKLVKSKIRVIG